MVLGAFALEKPVLLFEIHKKSPILSYQAFNLFIQVVLADTLSGNLLELNQLLQFNRLTLNQ